MRNLRAWMFGDTDDAPKDSIDVIGRLLSSLKDGASITCSTRVSQPDSLPDVATEPEQKTVDRAMRLRAQIGISFWDAVLLRAMELPEPPNTLLAGAGRHATSEVRLQLPADKHLTSRLRQICEVHPGSAVDVKSAIQLTGGSVLHIPMLDFRRPSLESASALAAAVVTTLDIGGGFLLWSGSSFHFWGAKLMTAAELPMFLGRALLFSPLVDSRWIGHQLIEGQCGLRISRSAVHPHAPRVVTSVSGKSAD
jgi:hypothetical protein